MKNLHLLFANIPEVTINDYGSLKSWIWETSHKQYWDQQVACLVDRQAAIPACPGKWPWPQ
jgi:hypothetical protein